MTIEPKEYSLKMSYDELWTITFYIRDSLTNAIDKYWVHHQNVWEENEKERLKTLKDFFNHLEKPELYDLLLLNIKKHFENFNKNKINE